MSTAFKTTLLIVFITFIALLLYDGEQVTTKHCNEILNEDYFCNISKKVKDIQNHGEISIHCLDLRSRKRFILSPGSTGNGWLFFDKIEIGDSIIKKSGEGIFYIINYPKRDSIVFNCDR